MSKDRYQPQPQNLDRVTLPHELDALVEMLARNVHENWAALRISQGWSYAPEHDTLQKQHPCLVPYEQLPETEKDYDRQTALQTLKLIVREGFEITKK